MSNSDANPIRQDVIRLPADALPAVEELSGDLRLLAETIGVDLAMVVGQVFQDTPIRIYGVKTLLLRYRNRRIRAECDAGETAARLARRYGLSERQIWNILGTAEPDERQMRMFND